MDFYPSTLVKLPSRGDTWYVSVTIPKEFRTGKAKQVRKSTLTTDLKTAQRRQHAIADAIYKSFKNPLAQELEYHAGVMIGADMQGRLGDLIDPDNRKSTIKWLLDQATELRFRRIPEDEDDGENSWLKNLASEELQPRLEQLLSAEQASGSPDTTENLTISDVLPDYLAGRPWGKLKTRDQTASRIRRFASATGEKPLAQLTKQDAYKYAALKAKEDAANKTISDHIGCVSVLLTWCEQRGLIESNPFANLKLHNYGKPQENRHGFTKEQLYQLFQLEIAPRERLLLEIMITTGMREDEAALLEWEDIKEEEGILFFDLREAIVKNKSSMRKLPVPKSLMLPPRGTGRLFNYRKDKDGKSSNHASRELMKVVRKITDDKRVVAHSLRHTFKTLARDAGISEELHDFITGHGKGDVSRSYGTVSLPPRLEALNKIEHPWLK